MEETQVRVELGHSFGVVVPLIRRVKRLLRDSGFLRSTKRVPVCSSITGSLLGPEEGEEGRTGRRWYSTVTGRPPSWTERERKLRSVVGELSR